MKSPFFKTIIFTITLLLSLNTMASPNIVVIVNEKNPISSIKKSELEDYFMKRVRNWSNGDVIRFFDHRDENINRKIFLEKFVEKTSREIELYWIGEKIYTGNVAPSKTTSDSMMALMVSRFPGGIGYVSSKYKIPKSVKILEIKKDNN